MPAAAAVAALAAATVAAAAAAVELGFVGWRHSGDRPDSSGSRARVALRFAWGSRV